MVLENSTETFDFELVSPEKRLMNRKARMVVIPGDEGDIGVLPNHSALLVSIRPGVIEVFDPGEEKPHKIFIASGFADITPRSCSVLAEEALPVKDMKKSELERSVQELQDSFWLAENEFEKGRIAKRIKIAQAKLDAVLHAHEAA